MLALAGAVSLHDEAQSFAIVGGTERFEGTRGADITDADDKNSLSGLVQIRHT